MGPIRLVVMLQLGIILQETLIQFFISNELVVLGNVNQVVQGGPFLIEILENMNLIGRDRRLFHRSHGLMGGHGQYPFPHHGLKSENAETQLGLRGLLIGFIGRTIGKRDQLSHREMRINLENLFFKAR
ncbi:hypothetical protein D3C73_1261210 [compost metagenome]